jgi:F0F1-type ATP synthase alpha subunit
LCKNRWYLLRSFKVANEIVTIKKYLKNVQKTKTNTLKNQILEKINKKNSNKPKLVKTINKKKSIDGKIKLIR